MKQVHIAIFASGGGSNAKKIISYFQNHAFIKISLILSNRKNAGVLDHANQHEIPSFVCSPSQWESQTELIQVLANHKVNYIVLAGFLKKIPLSFIQLFPNQIINIHPSLLPKYGGIGMYGHHVHEAVFENKEIESGMTIHLVNENYDEGQIILQKKCSIQDCQSADEIAKNVLQLEWEHYAPSIEKWISEDLKM